MEGLSLDAFLSIMIPLSLYFIITLLGAYLKDMLNTIRKKDTKFRLNRILIGAITGAFVMIGVENYLLARFSLQQVAFIAFIVGSVSFELFDRVSKLDNVIAYVKTFKQVFSEVKFPDTVDKDNENVSKENTSTTKEHTKE